MDVSKFFTNVKNLNEYVSVTHDMSSKYSQTKIRLNISTVLCLEKIKYLEIEYFNKYNKSGAAFGVLENILRLPPSKTWEVLSKNFVSILKYWFETLKHQIIQNNNNWWIFLLTLLKFVKELRTKHPSINNKILDILGEDLLHFAIHEKLSLNQRLETIQCFNICSADSSREIRFALRNKFGQHFIKISCLMSTCGDFRVQYSMMEALLRWLLPRKELEVRRRAAQEWFSEEFYSRGAVEIFLERDWRNFFKDARDFLNAQNETNNLVTSVICKKMSIGNLELISGTDRKYWLDFNIDNKCISLMLELKLQEVLNAKGSVSDALVITEDNVTSVKMLRDLQLLKIELTVIDPKLLYNSEVLNNKNDVTIYVKTTNVTKVNDSLQTIFENKYKILFDTENLSNLTQENTRESSQIENSEDNSRFSNPVQVRRRKRTGVVSSLRNLGDVKSPSTASTSSLALLREKLTALSGCEFEKEPVSVCAHPQLSSVTELSESEENINSLTRHIHKPRCGKVVSDNFNIPVIPAEKTNISTSRSHDEDSISCLLVATVGSIDEGVLNYTLNKFPKDKAINTDNYIVMRAQEDLQSKSVEINQKYDQVSDFQPEVIENTPLVQHFAVKTPEINIQQSTVESDTDIVEDTPKDTITKRKKPVNKDQLVFSRTSVSVNKEIDTQAYDNQAVEQFFSQHFREDRDGQLIISPTLARKVNETSSESDEFVLHVNYNVQDEFGFNQLDIVECLNEIVDKICEDLENYSQFISKDTQLQDITDKINSKPVLQTAEETMTKGSKNIEKNSKKKKTKPIKISFFKSPKKKNNKQNKSKKEKKLQLEAVNKMSTIYETSTVADNHNDTVKTPESNGKDESLVTRRRRKLYSPKNDLESYANKGDIVLETEDDNSWSELQKNNNSPKVSAYKEIENIRKSTRNLRNRKCITSTLSPRSKRMNDDFDNLLGKDNNNNEKCIKTNDKNLAIYNLSSDSEDSDFKVKKAAIVSHTADNESVASKRSRRNKPKINYSENKARPKKIRRKSIKNIKESIKITKYNLIDERVRDVPPENLDSSIVIAETEVKETCNELQPIVAITPQMETIDAELNKPKTKVRTKKTTKKYPKKQYQSKKTSEVKAVLDITGNREESISPGLHFEMLPKQNSDDSIVSLERIKDLSGDDSVGKQIDLNITQNMLNEDNVDDNPQNLITLEECSPHNLIEDMNNNVNWTANDKMKGPKVNKKINRAKKKKAKSSSSESNSFKLIEVTANIENVSNVAKKPLTRPKQSCDSQIPKRVNRNLPKNLDLVQSMNDSLSDVSRSSTYISKVRTISNKEIINSIVKSSPSVAVERLSLQEIRKWTPPRNNSVFGSIESESSRQTRSPLTKGIPKTSPKNKEKNISSISPIKLFEFTKPDSNTTSIFNSNTISKADNFRYGLRKRKGDESSSIISSTKRIRDSSNDSLKKSTFQSPKYTVENRILESPQNSRQGHLQSSRKDLIKKRIFQSPINRILESPENSRKGRNRRSPKDVAKKRIFQSPKKKNRILLSPEDSKKRHNQTSPKDVVEKPILKSPNDTEKRILRSMKKESQEHYLYSSQDSVKRSPQSEHRQDPECLVKVLSEGRPSTNSISYGASTTGSVHNWLRRSREAITSQPHHVVQSNTLQDIVNTINEKLEVTLAAIHQNTTDKFKVLHRDAQKQMAKARESRHALYRETATAILNEILEIMDNKFHEMETKCKKIDEQLLENVFISKTYILKIIAEDSRRTEELVALLKQDIKRIVNTAPL